MKRLDLDAADVFVIGAGPNGLAAAIVMAQAGLAVTIVEGADEIGGGLRSAELTLPGFTHDICAAVHPLGFASPFFRTLPLKEHGLEWVHPAAPVAHPLDNGACGVVERSLEATVERLERDGPAYNKLIAPIVEAWNDLEGNLLAPLRLPHHPLKLARFGAKAIKTARALAGQAFRNEPARALFAGHAAHSTLPLERRPSAAFSLILSATAHLTGWPVVKGGSKKFADALASVFQSLRGKIVTGKWVESLDQLPPARAVLCDLTVRQFLRVAGDRLPRAYHRKLERYRYGPGAYKVDWALSAPIPWKSAECARAGTVHLGGTLEEISKSERAPWRGEHAERPFVILCQPTLFDLSRAPQGKHTAWAYCHVPNGSEFSMLERIEAQVERFAPGFRDCVLARSVMAPMDLERHNPNLSGGDINGGVQDLWQLVTRPTARAYATPVKGLYLCSSSTPPGGGVHGMCGYHAATLALRQVFGKVSRREQHG